MKKIILGFILGGIVFTLGGVVASTMISSKNVTYQNKTVNNALDELYNNATTGKELVAAAITNKGVTTTSNDTYETMVTNISSIDTDHTEINQKINNLESKHNIDIASLKGTINNLNQSMTNSNVRYNSDTDMIEVYNNGKWSGVLNAKLKSHNLIPIMTTNTAPRGTASCSSNFQSSDVVGTQSAAYKAFNGDNSTGWTSTHTYSWEYSAQWLQYTFINAVNIDKIIINIGGRNWSQTNYSPTGSSPITISTSTDGSTWKTAKQVTIKDYTNDVEVTELENANNIKAIRLTFTGYNWYINNTVAASCSKVEAWGLEVE